MTILKVDNPTSTGNTKVIHDKVIAEQAKKVLEPKKLYDVINITKELSPPGFTLNLEKGQIKVGEQGIATLAEVQNLSNYLKVVD